MAISITNIGTNSNTSGASVAISSVTVPAGALIFVAATEYDGSTQPAAGTISDAYNTYTSGYSEFSKTVSTKACGNYFYVEGAAALSGATITFTKNKTGDEAAISAFYATGVATSSALDSAVSVNSLNQTSSASPLFSLTSGTPAVAGELLVAVVCSYDYTGAYSWFTEDTGNGWATPLNEAASSDYLAIVDGGTQVLSGTGTVTFSPVNTSSRTVQYSAWIFGFKPPSIPFVGAPILKTYLRR